MRRRRRKTRDNIVRSFILSVSVFGEWNKMSDGFTDNPVTAEHNTAWLHRLV